MLLPNLSCMNRPGIIAIILFSLICKPAFCQKEPDRESALSGEELVNYESQARQLVSFMELAFNTLGSAQTEYKDKHTIIEQSYLKFFKNEKVQIEDDLVEKRDMVTNKDVQAYLKDIDFFFTSVTFKYTIEEITQEFNESGEVFFKIRTSRNLKGTSIDGNQLNDNLTRYIEVNLDQTNRDLKIASIYTTKSSEEQELIEWWNGLDKGWRDFLAGSTKLNDSVYLKNITTIHNDYLINETVQSDYQDTLILVDTIRFNTARAFADLRRILRAEQLNLTDVDGIFNLDPLSEFAALKHLDITKAHIPSLEPVRNLSKLETLVASQSLISSIEPIKYMPRIRVLDISGTLVNSIEPLEGFENLEVLDLSDSKVMDISILKNLKKLSELKINGLRIDSLDVLKDMKSLVVLEVSRTPVTTLVPIQGLLNLNRLSIDQTDITDLSPLTEMGSLENIFLDNTAVSSLNPLGNLPKLKMVYCDKSSIQRSDALAFMQSHPEVRVIYESQELMAWWQQIPDTWKKIFSGLIQLSDPPTREQLHEISFIKTLNVSGNMLISTLSPLDKLSSLQELNLSGTRVSDLTPLANLFDLKSLNIAYTAVKELAPIAGLTGLQNINFSNTMVTDIAPLVKLPGLRSVRMDSTNITNVALMGNIKRLDLLYADGVESLPAQLNNLWDSIPEILVIYQTAFLKGWWQTLPLEWKEVFNTCEVVGEVPASEQLHRVSSLKELDISRVNNISDIKPLAVLARLEILNISSLQLTDLSPLSKTSRLKVLDLSDTPVTDLSPLMSHKSLEELNCSNSLLNNIDIISGFKNLKKLNISGTRVSKLDPLENCLNLEELDCYNTRINNLKVLDKHQHLKMVRVYNTRLSDRKIQKFKGLHPGTEVVFY